MATLSNVAGNGPVSESRSVFRGSTGGFRRHYTLSSPPSPLLFYDDRPSVCEVLPLHLENRAETDATRPTPLTDPARELDSQGHPGTGTLCPHSPGPCSPPGVTLFAGNVWNAEKDLRVQTDWGGQRLLTPPLGKSQGR